MSYPGCGAPVFNQALPLNQQDNAIVCFGENINDLRSEDRRGFEPQYDPRPAPHTFDDKVEAVSVC
jgi:hypothetical protein